MPRLIKRLSLYRALKLGYTRNEKRQARKLKKYGYILDKELSDNQHMVAYSPFEKKVIFVSNGSETSLFHPVQLRKDWHANFLEVPTGMFAYTPRFAEDKSAYLKTKKKYGEDTKVQLIGHSQAAISVNELAKGNDRGITYNGALIKQKDNPNVTNYRHPFDIVSSFANPQDMQTLRQQQPNMRTTNYYTAHGVDTIKQVPIFV